MSFWDVLPLNLIVRILGAINIKKQKILKMITVKCLAITFLLWNELPVLAIPALTSPLHAMISRITCYVNLDVWRSIRAGWRQFNEPEWHVVWHPYLLVSGDHSKWSAHLVNSGLRSNILLFLHFQRQNYLQRKAWELNHDLLILDKTYSAHDMKRWVSPNYIPSQNN